MQLILGLLAVQSTISLAFVWRVMLKGWPFPISHNAIKKQLLDGPECKMVIIVLQRGCISGVLVSKDAVR
jgi:hypothetical protein